MWFFASIVRFGSLKIARNYYDCAFWQLSLYLDPSWSTVGRYCRCHLVWSVAHDACACTASAAMAVWCGARILPLERRVYSITLVVR